jgi:hypothetical protein
MMNARHAVFRKKNKHAADTLHILHHLINPRGEGRRTDNQIKTKEKLIVSYLFIQTNFIIE